MLEAAFYSDSLAPESFSTYIQLQIISLDAIFYILHGLCLPTNEITPLDE